MIRMNHNEKRNTHCETEFNQTGKALVVDGQRRIRDLRKFGAISTSSDMKQAVG
jgi:hypothetical protein